MKTRSRELIGWAALALFVVLVWRMRRALEP
jgi:hypothetical protein